MEKQKLEDVNAISFPENCPGCKQPVQMLSETFGLIPVLSVGGVNPLVCPNCGCWFTPKKALFQIMQHLLAMKRVQESGIVTPERKLTLV